MRSQGVSHPSCLHHMACPEVLRSSHGDDVGLEHVIHCQKWWRPCPWDRTGFPGNTVETVHYLWDLRHWTCSLSISYNQPDPFFILLPVLKNSSGLFGSLEVTSFHLVVMLMGRWQVLSTAHGSLALNRGLRRSTWHVRELLSPPEDRVEGVCGYLIAEMPTTAWVGWRCWSRVSVPATFHLYFQCPLLLLCSLFSLSLSSALSPSLVFHLLPSNCSVL